MSEAPTTAHVLVTFGGLFLIGLLADLAGRHTPLPRVTLLLISGFVIGPAVLNWLPEFAIDWFPILTDIALTMIGFLLGHNMTHARFSELGRPVLTMSIGEVVATALLVFLVLVSFGVATEIALLLAGIAPATAPAATVDVVQEYEARGTFTDTLLGIVAIDDVWGLLVFSLLLAVAQALTGQGDAIGSMARAGWEIGGAALVGLLLGMPMAYLTGRIRPGQPSQAEALGVVLLCAGLAEWLGVSYILAAIALGAVVANVATHHDKSFQVIEGIEWPFLILFFLVAGATLEVQALSQAGLLTGGYIILRILGRILGTRLGGRASGTAPVIRNWIGVALLPQAGVAIGMALVASQRFPDIKDILLPIVLGSTVLFELIGPVATRWALARVGDIPATPTAQKRS